MTRPERWTGGAGLGWAEGEGQDQGTGAVVGRLQGRMEVLEDEVNRCKYKLRGARRGEEGARKRGPKPRLRTAGMAR